MSALDEIIRKRQEAETARKASALHEESVGAVLHSGKSITDQLKEDKSTPSKVELTENNLAKKSDIDGMIAQLKELQLTSLLNGMKDSGKLPERQVMNITDSAAYVGDSIKELSEKVMARLEDESNDKATTASLLELKTILTSIQSAIGGESSAITKLLGDLSKKVDGIDVKPVINVPAANITVPKLDLKPLQKTMEHYFSKPEESDSLDLECYRAQDLINDGDIQYVGFVNTIGNWYIIENRIKENSLRYVFGDKDYSEAFTHAAQYEYLVLNEAINALSA